MTTTKSSTYQWCGSTKEPLSDVERAILYHEHEANRAKFFGMMKEQEYHEYMVQTINKGKA